MKRWLLGLLGLLCCYALGACKDDASTEPRAVVDGGGSPPSTPDAGRPAESCDEIDFRACGGDLIGGWQYTLGCAEVPGMADDADAGSPSGMCEGQSVEVTLDLNGTITFDEDGSYEMNQAFDVVSVVTVPKSCLMDMPCTTLGPAAEELGDDCVSTSSNGDTNIESGTFVIAGDSFTTVHEDADTLGNVASEPIPFCIERDVLTARVTNPNGQTFLFRAERL